MNVHHWLATAGRFLRDEDGPTAVEYAVLLALIVVACVGSIMLLAEKTNESFETSGDAIDGAFNG